MADGDRSELEASLRRVEALIAGLDRIADPAAREPARELLELVLDLHTLGLARIIAIVAAAAGGAALLDRLAEDPQARAILLLHGLRPQEAEARIRAALGRLRPDWVLRGIGVLLREVRGGVARLRATAGGNGRVDAVALRAEIEAAIVEAAPDLDDILIEGLDERGNLPPPRRAGEMSCPARLYRGTGCSQLRHFVSPPAGARTLPNSAQRPDRRQASAFDRAVQPRGRLRLPRLRRHPTRPPRRALSPGPAEFAAVARLCHDRRAVGGVSDPDRPGVCFFDSTARRPVGALSGARRRDAIRARPRSVVANWRRAIRC